MADPPNADPSRDRSLCSASLWPLAILLNTVRNDNFFETNSRQGNLIPFLVSLLFSQKRVILKFKLLVVILVKLQLVLPVDRVDNLQDRVNLLLLVIARLIFGLILKGVMLHNLVIGDASASAPRPPERRVYLITGRAGLPIARKTPSKHRRVFYHEGPLNDEKPFLVFLTLFESMHVGPSDALMTAFAGNGLDPMQATRHLLVLLRSQAHVDDAKQFKSRG